jgi:hypothetical protein
MGAIVLLCFPKGKGQELSKNPNPNPTRFQGIFWTLEVWQLFGQPE